MKKLAAFILLIASTVLLCACDGNTEPDMSDISTSPSESVTVSTEHTTTTENTETPVNYNSAYSPLRFLSDSNYGSLLWTPTETVAPGTQADPGAIPQPEQDSVGTTVQISLTFPDSDGKYAVAFHYLRNEETGNENLVLILSDDKLNFPLLIVLKTDFGSANVMLEHIQDQKVFTGEILAMVNTDYEEGIIFVRNAVLGTTGIADHEIVDIQSPGQLDGIEYIGYLSSDQALMVKGGSGEEISEELENDLNVWRKIYDRFNLSDLVSL